MATEDDVVLVIVDDDDAQKKGKKAKKKAAPVKKKHNTRSMKPEPAPVEQLIETAEKLGTPMDIEKVILKKEPIEYVEYEYLEVDEGELPDDEIGNVKDVKVEKEEISTEYDSRDEEDLDVPHYDKGVHRFKMLAPHERHSYVEDLRKDNPELRKNKKALVEAISKMMEEQIKPPDVPDSAFRINEETSLFQCTLCNAEKVTKIAAMRHYQEKHGPRFLVCYACGVDFRSCTNLYKHEKRCAAPDAVLVLRARALAVTRRIASRPFALPKREAPPTKNTFACSLCPATYSSRPGLSSHERLHRGERPFTCSDCGAAYTSAPSLRRHQASHQERRFACDHCDFRSHTKVAMATHCSKHLPQKRFPCDVTGCKQRFATKAGMQLHVAAIHLRLPPQLPCALCEVKFRRMYLLKQHMLKVHKMHLITKKMFFKSLPKLKSTELPAATIVYGSEPTYDPKEINIQMEAIEKRKTFFYAVTPAVDSKEDATSGGGKRKRNRKAVIVKNFDDTPHSADSDEFLDMASGNCEVIDNAESFKNLLNDSENYQVYVIENGQVTKKVEFQDIKDQLLADYGVVD